MRATAFWPVVQPSIWIAGTSSAPRSGELVPAEPLCARHGGAERLDAHVLREGAGEVAEGLLPVEALRGEIAHRGDAGLGRGLEVGVRLQARRLGHDGGAARLQLGEVGLVLLDRVRAQHIAGEHDHAEGESAEDDIRPRAARGLPGGGDRRGLERAAQVGRKQVDGFHA